MLDFLLNIFKKKTKDSELISEFDEALYFIKTYEKAEDFKNWILATRELILKHKSWINYYEEELKKLYSLESSNIANIAKVAKDKIKKRKEVLDTLYKRLSILEKYLMDIEKRKEKKEQSTKASMELERFKFKKGELLDFIKKKDYIKAIVHAKKMVYDFPNSKEALHLLQKTQKLYDSDKLKKDKERAKKEKIQKTLNEFWIDTKEFENKKITFWDEFKLKLKEIKKKREDRSDYIKRMQTIRKFELLLAKTWSIDNISQFDLSQAREEDFSIINWWLTKDIKDFEMYWFDFFWQIIWKEKIIWDTFGHFKNMNNKVVFYFWDATWHWVQAWFTVAILSKIFIENSKSYKLLSDLVFKVNNFLKEKIKWKSFVTWIFFEWDYVKNSLKMVWAWHPPLFIYRKSERKIEKIIPWWLALWVRNIANISSVKMKDITLNNWDVIFGYTDGIVEAKNHEWIMFWINNIEEMFLRNAQKFTDPQKIYEWMLSDFDLYRWNIEINDDASFFIFVRNTNKDLIVNKTELEQILKEANSKKKLRDIQFNKKTKEDLIEELKKEKQERELKIRLERLDRLAKIWEYIKLKQEVLIYYKEWYMHEKMQHYLEKAIANEQKVAIRKLEEKLQRKYDTLIDLYKKWEYETVIKEATDIIFKNWKI